MTASPDPLDGAAREPADLRRRPLMGPGFWAIMAFSVLCVLGGAAIVGLGPRLLAPKPAPPPAAAPRAPLRPLAPDELLSPAPPGVGADSLPAAPGGAASEQLQRLEERLTAVEGRETRLAEAAAQALAAAALVEAAQSSRPFSEELAALEQVSPPSAELRALRQLAATGAPSRVALAASFPDSAARAVTAGRAPGADAGLLQRIGYALSRVVSLRRVGDVPGDGAEAVLARAERLVSDGDLDHALRTLDSLPPAARNSLASWRAGAERRAEIDRRAAALRTQALQALGRIAGPHS